jgi:hypothetical protein
VNVFQITLIIWSPLRQADRSRQSISILKNLKTFAPMLKIVMIRMNIVCEELPIVAAIDGDVYICGLHFPG